MRAKVSPIDAALAYDLAKLKLALELQREGPGPATRHLFVARDAWEGRTWVEEIIHRHGHLAERLVNRDVKRGGQFRMFGEEVA